MLLFESDAIFIVRRPYNSALQLASVPSATSRSFEVIVLLKFDTAQGKNSLKFERKSFVIVSTVAPFYLRESVSGGEALHLYISFSVAT